MNSESNYDMTHANPSRSFSVNRCSHGLFHLRFDRLTVSMNPSEFEKFAKTITGAYLRFGINKVVDDVQKSTSRQTVH